VITRTSLSRGFSPAGFGAAISSGLADDEKAIVLPSGDHSGFPRAAGDVGDGPWLAARHRHDEDLRRLRPAVALDGADECEAPAVGRPARARVADAARQRARRLAAVGLRDPDRRLVGVGLLVDVDTDERDLGAVGRHLWIGDPDEREDVLLRDRATLREGGLRQDDERQQSQHRADGMLHGMWRPASAGPRGDCLRLYGRER
jgi:hypothetical protein